MSIPAAQLVTAISYDSFALARAVCTADGFLNAQTATWLLTLLESVGEARSFLTAVIREEINAERSVSVEDWRC